VDHLQVDPLSLPYFVSPLLSVSTIDWEIRYHIESQSIDRPLSTAEVVPNSVSNTLSREPDVICLVTMVLYIE